MTMKGNIKHILYQKKVPSCMLFTAKNNCLHGNFEVYSFYEWDNYYPWGLQLFLLVDLVELDLGFLEQIEHPLIGPCEANSLGGSFLLSSSSSSSTVSLCDHVQMQFLWLKLSCFWDRECPKVCHFTFQGSLSSENILRDIKPSNIQINKNTRFT